MAEVSITRLAGFGLATILPAKGVEPAQIGAALGIPLAPGARASGDGALALLGTGPGQWLACAKAAAPDWADALGERLAGLAGVVDQSGGYELFCLSGADALRVVQKGMPVDLSPAAFAPGAVAVSAIAHIGVIVHHVAPGVLHLAVFRSFAASFLHWLDETARAP